MKDEDKEQAHGFIRGKGTGVDPNKGMGLGRVPPPARHDEITDITRQAIGEAQALLDAGDMKGMLDHLNSVPIEIRPFAVREMDMKLVLASGSSRRGGDEQQSAHAASLTDPDHGNTKNPASKTMIPGKGTGVDPNKGIGLGLVPKPELPEPDARDLRAGVRHEFIDEPVLPPSAGAGPLNWSFKVTLSGSTVTVAAGNRRVEGVGNWSGVSGTTFPYSSGSVVYMTRTYPTVQSDGTVNSNGAWSGLLYGSPPASSALVNVIRIASTISGDVVHEHLGNISVIDIVSCVGDDDPEE